jgi:hypothetical protein
MYLYDRFMQLTSQAFVDFCRWVDRMNADADRQNAEILRAAQERMAREEAIEREAKEQEIKQKPDDPETPMGGVGIKPDGPGSGPAAEAEKIERERQYQKVAFKHRLEMPAYKIEVPSFEFKPDDIAKRFELPKIESDRFAITNDRFKPDITI